MKKIISYFLVFAIAFSLIPGLPFSAFAETEKDVTLATFIVEERNGAYVEKFLAQRGVPLEDGKLLPNEGIYVVNEKTGELCFTESRVMETYESGYVKWILFTIIEELAPYEKNTYAVKKGYRDFDSMIKCKEDGGIVTVDNGVLKASFDSAGLFSLNYENVEFFDNRGTMSSCVETVDEERIKFDMTNGKVEIVEVNRLYAKIKITSNYGDSTMSSEQVYTIVAGSRRIGCMHSYISSNAKKLSAFVVDQYADINSLYETFYLNKNFDTVEYGDGEWSSGGEPIVSSDYVKVSNSNNGMSFSIVTKDVERFRRAIKNEIRNGFYFENGKLIYSPVFYDTEFQWMDGWRRTTRCEIILQKGNDISLAGAYETLKDTPAVTVSVDAFIKTGIVASSKVSALAERIVESIKWTKEKNKGSFAAGYLPYGFDPQNDMFAVTPGGVYLGEVEYHTWHTAITTGDPDLFDIVRESAEGYMDIGQYWGVVEEARGLTKARGNEAGSHAYYGDFSLFYLSYLMTGDEMFYDACYAAADVTERVATAAAPQMGHTYLDSPMWDQGMLYDLKATNEGQEMRYALMIRAFQSAYNMFKEERFKNLAKEISELTGIIQEEDGSWVQNINGYLGNSTWHPRHDNGNRGWFMYKIYIMLYWSRGLCEYYEQTKDPDVLNQLKKFADYLIVEMGEYDWTWVPSRKTPIQEDLTAGRSGYTQSMSSEIFYTVYNATGESQYFNALCRVLSDYLAISTQNGFAAHRYGNPELNPVIDTVNCYGQNSSLLHIDSHLCKLFTEKRELAIEMGYEGVAAVYADDTEYTPEDAYCADHTIEVRPNLYRAGDKRYLFLGNITGYYTGVWDKDVEVQISGRPSLWTQLDCYFDNMNEVTVKKHIEHFNGVYSVEIPVRLQNVFGSVTASVIAYNDKQIAFKASGDGNRATFLINNGDFEIKEGIGYNVSISGGKDKIVYITKGGNHYPTSEGLKIELDFSAENEFVFTDLIGHWSEYDVMAMYKQDVVKGVSETEFAPNASVTRLQAIYFVMRIFGINDEDAVQQAIKYGMIAKDTNLDELATREEIINYCIIALNSMGRKVNLTSAEVYEFTLAGETSNDQNAVLFDLEAIEFESTHLKTNLQLPTSGVYGSSIEWSGGGKYLSNEGKVVIPSDTEGAQKAKLTATATRGAAKESKEFEFVIEPISYTDIKTVSYENRYEIPTMIGDFSVEFEGTCFEENADWCIAFLDSDVNEIGFDEMPITVRFGREGIIDVKDGELWTKTSVNYDAGAKYTFQVKGNTDTRKFNLTIIMPDGSKVESGPYDFRSTSGKHKKLDLVTSHVSLGSAILNRVSVRGGMGSGEYGYVQGSEFFDITEGNLEIIKKDGWNYFSTAPEYVNTDGCIIALPNRILTGSVIGISSNIKLMEDIFEVKPASFANVLTAQEIGLVIGDNRNRLNPKKICSRAETLTIIRRLYDYYVAKSI